jgi:hypothetical protein
MMIREALRRRLRDGPVRRSLGRRVRSAFAALSREPLVWALVTFAFCRAALGSL